METVNIIGGGIAGLSLANALQCAGIDFKLFEQAPQLTEVGAAIGISKAALDILEILGLSEQVKNGGNETRSLRLSNKNLEVIRVISPEWPSVIIHRAKLIDILTSRLPKERIQLNAKLVYLKSDKDSSILKFSNGMEINSACTAIADGIQSKFRQQIFPEIKIRYSGQTIWRGITAMQLPEYYSQTYSEIWSATKRFLFAPMDTNFTCWLAVKNAKVGGQDNPDTIRNELMKEYHNFHPIVKELLLRSSNFIRNDLADLGAQKRKWYHHKIVFLGDAIHATTPNLAQGGCQAIEDAYCLAKLMDKSRNDLSKVFPVYQSLRSKKVSFIVNTSWRFGKIAHNSLTSYLAKYYFKYAPNSSFIKLERKLNDLSYLDKEQTKD